MHVEIDTTPTMPKPPDPLVRAAANEVPNVLANVQPRHDGKIAMIGSHLAKRLQDAGHTLAAAQWGIHDLVQRKLLVPGTVAVETPSVGVWRGSRIPRLYGGARSGHMEWYGGKTGTVAIPQGKPAPYECFEVTATDDLWAWWHEEYNFAGNATSDVENVAGATATEATDVFSRQTCLLQWSALLAKFAAVSLGTRNSSGG